MHRGPVFVRSTIAVTHRHSLFRQPTFNYLFSWPRQRSIRVLGARSAGQPHSELPVEDNNSTATVVGPESFFSPSRNSGTPTLLLDVVGGGVHRPGSGRSQNTLATRCHLCPLRRGTRRAQPVAGRLLCGSRRRASGNVSATTPRAVGVGPTATGACWAAGSVRVACEALPLCPVSACG